MKMLGVFGFTADVSDSAGFSMIQNGYWKTWITCYLTKELRTGHHFYSIGAGYGYFPLLASCLVGPHGQVIGVEPNPILYEYFTRNIQYNKERLAKSHSSIIAMNCALGPFDSDAKHVLEYSPTDLYGGRLVDESNSKVHKLKKGNARTAVESTTLAAIYKSPKNVRSLVYIDTNGSELSILESSMATLMKRRLKILVELNEEQISILMSKHSRTKAFSYISYDGNEIPFRPSQNIFQEGQRRTMVLI